VARKSETSAPESMPHLHPLVIATRKELLQAEPGRDGFFYTWKSVRMRVSRAGQARALSLADMVLREVERQGFEVRPLKEKPNERTGGAWISTDVRQIELIIREEMKRHDHQVTEEEEVQIKETGYYSPPRYDWKATGNIFVVFEAQFEPTVIIKEGLRARQEERLPSIIDALKAMVQRAREHDADIERSRAEYEEAQRRKAKEAAEREREHQREEDLIRAMTAWQRAHGIRAFVAAATSTMSAKTAVGVTNAGDLQDWAKWALSFADRIDPLVRSEGCPWNLQDTRGTG
jgi:hypothetical protein